MYEKKDSGVIWNWDLLTLFCGAGGPKSSSASARLQSIGRRRELLPRAAAAGVPRARHLAREPHPCARRGHRQCRS